MPKAPSKRRVIARDETGRPTLVEDPSVDPAVQCPGCLSLLVHPVGAIGFLPAGDEIDPTGAVRKMVCRSCGGSWMRAGM